MSVELELILVDDLKLTDMLNEEDKPLPDAPFNVWYNAGTHPSGAVMYQNNLYEGLLIKDVDGEFELIDWECGERWLHVDRLYERILWSKVQPSVRITHSCSYP